jgi:MSHA biogenesis protein MshO
MRITARIALSGAGVQGFTLVELVMVIALAGAVAVMIGSVMSRPLQGFVDQSRRAQLVDFAATALQRVSRDVRLAVPNSMQTNGNSLEMLNVVAAGRYRPNRSGSDGLRFAAGTDASCTANVVAGAGECNKFQVLDPSLSTEGALWMVVFNIGALTGGNPTAGANVWAAAAADGSHVITPAGTAFARADLAGQETLVTVTPPGGTFNFAFPSAARRFYLVDQVIGYRCDLVNGRLLRYTRDTLVPAFSGATTVVANHVTGCSLSYQEGNLQRSGLVNLSLQLTLEGESIQLLQQVHVDNAP